MSLRWRIAIGFALVALATAAVIALATPPIVTQGFNDYDNDTEIYSGASAASAGLGAQNPEANDDSESSVATPAPVAAQTPIPAQTPIAAAAAAVVTPGPNQGATETAPAAPPTNPGAEQATIMRLILLALGAAMVASLFGLFAAGRLVQPLTRLEQAAASVARGDLAQRSGLAGRSDEFGQLGRTFDSMAGQLQQAEESRRRFLQDAAHELKTPLAVIEATSSAIIDGVYRPEPRHVETIRDQSRILARIVDDLRTISLAEGGHLPLERRPLDVRSLLQSVAAGFEARAATGSVALTVEAGSGLVVDADPDRLRQVVGALVDNSLRHVASGGRIGLVALGAADSSRPPSRPSSVPSSGPSSRPSARHASQIPVGRGLVRIVVDDDGPGFPPDTLDSVFERFYQADPSRSRGSGTSGLGLSIVRALVEAHGGRVGADNRPEGGARIWIELPALGGPDARARQSSERPTIE